MNTVRGTERVGAGEPLDPGSDRQSAGADHKLVVADRLLTARAGGYEELVAFGVNPLSDRVEAQPHTGRFKIAERAVRELPPVGHLAREVVGDAADREVRVGVVENDVNLARRIEFSHAQCGADPRIAPADDDDASHGSTLAVSGRATLLGLGGASRERLGGNGVVVRRAPSHASPRGRRPSRPLIGAAKARRE